MTRIHNFIFRARKQKVLSKIERLPADYLCNETTREKYSNTKELSGPSCQLDEYQRFSTNSPQKNFLPSPLAIVLVIILMAVFLIFPVIYLLHCFTLFHPNELDNKFKNHLSSNPKLFINDNDFDIAETHNPYHTVKSLPPPPEPDYNQCRLLEDIDKLDCFPTDGANQVNCEARGCCWMPGKTVSKPKSALKITKPYCFFPPNYNTYNYLNITQTAFGLTAYLKRNFQTPYPGDVEVIQLTVKYETESRLHIKITDPLVDRFEPPYPEVPIVDVAAVNLLYQFNIDRSIPGFKIIRRLDNVTIFDALNFNNLIYTNQFLQISGKLPSKNIYGIGEHTSSLVLPTEWSRFTLFNRDGIPEFNENLYGSHPFYMVLEDSTNSHGVFLLNSNAMDVIVQPAPAITFRPIGGILDLYFFLGPTPSDVINQYTEVIGKPYMPPYWGLGFHLCRFGFRTLNETKEVMQRNLDAGIPLDTQWNDLDYMNKGNDFTYDAINFEGLPEFIGELHANGMHYIPLIDAGVSGSEPANSYPPYDEGVKMDIFVKNSTGQILVGKVWNTVSTVWPDFTNPDTVDYWTLMLQNLHDKIQFDGAWIDMNEPSNFLDGSTTGCPNNNIENPPFVPAVVGGSLKYKTLCMTAKHYAGSHYDVHNLFGFTEAILTSFAMAEIRGKRPMVISRSTFAGHGHYAGHWSGDVVSNWNDMRYSIPQLLSFSLYGIPLMGADICGFNGNSTESLCNRWMQLGAFYPFSRNHNSDDTIAQDPAIFGELVIRSSVKALKVRYSLLPYLYTLFWAAHVKGETVARPLFFEFTSDRATYSIDNQFLWGPAIMIVPVLQENDVSVVTYLPSGVWYDIYNYAAIASTGEQFTISAPLDTIPVFVRGGYIIPQQEARKTTTESRLTHIQLLVAPDEEGNAVGQLYWDDGDSLNTYEEENYSFSEFTMNPGVLRILNLYKNNLPPNLGLVTILGINSPVSAVAVNDKPYKKFKYDGVYKYLVISDLDESWEDSIVITWEL